MVTISLTNTQIPQTENELLERCLFVEGLSFAQLGIALGYSIPINPNTRKGWIGQLLELALGTDAGNKACPDFQNLGIELKTIPIGLTGKPIESTYVTSIPLLSIHQQHWESSQCYAKLKRILWVPIEGDIAIPYAQRRIGRAFIWSPDERQGLVLAADWDYLVQKICIGDLETIDASIGTYLHIRPKAAHGKSLCYGFDAEGNKIQTLPRGFYLRTSFTEEIMRTCCIY